MRLSPIRCDNGLVGVIPVYKPLELRMQEVRPELVTASFH